MADPSVDTALAISVLREIIRNQPLARRNPLDAGWKAEDDATKALNVLEVALASGQARNPAASPSVPQQDELREAVAAMLEREAASIRASYKAATEWNRAQANAFDRAAVSVRLGWPALVEAALASSQVDAP